MPTTNQPHQFEESIPFGPEDDNWIRYVIAHPESQQPMSESLPQNQDDDSYAELTAQTIYRYPLSIFLRNPPKLKNRVGQKWNKSHVVPQLLLTAFNQLRTNLDHLGYSRSKFQVYISWHGASMLVNMPEFKQYVQAYMNLSKVGNHFDVKVSNILTAPCNYGWQDYYLTNTVDAYWLFASAAEELRADVEGELRASVSLSSALCVLLSFANMDESEGLVDGRTLEVFRAERANFAMYLGEVSDKLNEVARIYN